MTPPSLDAVGRRLPLRALTVAALAGAAGVAGSYAVAGFTPSFVVGPIAGFLARRLPAAVITFAITTLGDLGERLNVLAAVGIATTLFAAVALLGLAVGTRTRGAIDARGRAESDDGGRPRSDDGGGSRSSERWDLPIGGLLAAAGVAVVAVAVTGAPLPSLAAGAAAGLVVGVAEIAPAPIGSAGRDVTSASPARRRVLRSAATAVVAVIGGTVLGRRGGLRDVGVPDGDGDGGGGGFDPDGDGVTSGRTVASLLDEASEKSLDVTGLEPLVSDEFYQVDINATDPVIDADDWKLAVTGAVETERTYTYADIRSMEATNQFVSLRCVGEPLNGRKLDNAVWTGVPVTELVDPAVPAEECCVMFRAHDGFFEEFPLAALEDGILAYGMNGRVLPRGHGYPVRALIPGHWGEINVKWITEIEILREEQDGYWELRGWHGTGPVNTVAKLHAVEDRMDGRKQVAGHAYAGTRGIDRVEVSTDGGETWTDATLSATLSGEDVWRQWSYTYDPPGRRHEVVVRATDGTGALQAETEADAYPNGASGWVSKTVE